MFSPNPIPGSTKGITEKILNFLRVHQRLYNYPNTHIMTNNIKELFSEEWLHYFKTISIGDIHNLGLGTVNADAPTSLKTFLEDLSNLEAKTEITKLETKEDAKWKSQKFAALTPKKKLEIISIVPLINSICEETNSTIVIDIGTGLGYLALYLNLNYGIRVLGIEGDRTKYNLALDFQNKHHPETKDKVKYFHHFITEESAEIIGKKLQEEFLLEENSGIVIAGLHACADLSANVLKLFLNMPKVQGLAIAPCCYHKLRHSRKEDSEEHFMNFPVSLEVKHICSQLNASKYLRTPFLRLACQQNMSSWRLKAEKDHMLHAKNLMFRCLLQCVADEENLEISRMKRKTGQSENNHSEYTIETYLENLDTSFTFKNSLELSQNVTMELIKQKLLEKWEVHSEDLNFIEILTAFQNLIQGICEQAIVFDRLLYLEENGARCRIMKIMDSETSPRSYVILSSKET